MKRSFVILLLLCTAAALAIYLNGMAVLRDLPGWAYRPIAKAPVHWLAASLTSVGILGAASIAYLCVKSRKNSIACAVLMLTGACAQFGMVFADPAGIELIWRRHFQGHAEFMRVAHAQEGKKIETILNYEEWVTHRRLGAFATTKPPGVLAIYMGIDELAHVKWIEDALRPIAEEAGTYRGGILRPYAHFVALSTILMPLFSQLTIALLFLLARAFNAKTEIAFGAAVLWLTTPSHLFITYHLDGVLYPSLALLSAWLAVFAGRGTRIAPIFSILLGLAFALHSFISFSLTPIVLLSFFFWMAAVIDASNKDAKFTRLLMHILGVALGLALGLYLLRVTLDYDVVMRWSHALVAHAEWKPNLPRQLWRILSFVEFGSYIGIPLAVLFPITVFLGARAKDRTVRTLAIGVAFTILATGLALPDNEVARLWMFYIPFIAWVISTQMPRFARTQGPHSFLPPLLALTAAQLLVAIAMKTSQPW